MSSTLLLLSLAALPAAAQSPTDVIEERRLLRELVERKSIELASREVQPPDRFEIESYRFGGGNATAGGALDLETESIEGPNQSGFVRFRFRVLVDGRLAGHVRSSVRGVVRGPVLTAERTLTRGETVGADAVRISEENLTRLVGEPLRSPEQVAGMVPVRTLAGGRPLTRDLMRATPIVRRGETVKLTVRRAGLTVTSRGRVMSDGAPGETVPVVGSSGGVRLLGQVLPDGSLLVVRRVFTGVKR